MILPPEAYQVRKEISVLDASESVVNDGSIDTPPIREAGLSVHTGSVLQ